MRRLGIRLRHRARNAAFKTNLVGCNCSTAANYPDNNHADLKYRIFVRYLTEYVATSWRPTVRERYIRLERLPFDGVLFGTLST
jgi:hypothetical protein